MKTTCSETASQLIRGAKWVSAVIFLDKTKEDQNNFTSKDKHFNGIITLTDRNLRKMG